MKRDIKFRAWDKEENKMIQWEDLKFEKEPDEDLFLWKRDSEISWSGFSDFELMQYTGLKDKDGKEIYEGDIVACFNFDDADFRSEVIYKNGAFGYKSQVFDVFVGFESNESFKWCNGKSEKTKVIGNIYENPELLEEEV